VVSLDKLGIGPRENASVGTMKQLIKIENLWLFLVLRILIQVIRSMPKF
jgi:hypothetical protein